MGRHYCAVVLIKRNNTNHLKSIFTDSYMVFTTLACVVRIIFRNIMSRARAFVISLCRLLCRLTVYVVVVVYVVHVLSDSNVSTIAPLHNLGRLGLDGASVPALSGDSAIDRVVLGDHLRLRRCVPGLAAQDLSVSSDEEQWQDHQ